MANQRSVVVVHTADGTKRFPPLKASEILGGLLGFHQQGVLDSTEPDGLSYTGSIDVPPGEYKLVPAAGPAAGAAAGPAAAAMSERVSKIMVDDQCMGTLVRITQTGLCVSASHVLVDQGKFLQQATAFGGAALRLLGSSPSHDVVFVQGPSGSSFDLLHTPLVVGLSVTLLAHPLAPQLDLSTPEHPVTLPTVAQGHVVAVAPSGELAAAEYHGAMPSSSGGAVLMDNIHFAGLHLGTSYHLDTTHMRDEEEPVADPSRWDTDPAAMWQGAGSHGSQGKRRAAGDPDVATAANQLQTLVLHAANNIAHKDQLAVFVPAMTIIRLAQHHKLLGLSDMEVVQQQHVARSQH